MNRFLSLQGDGLKGTRAGGTAPKPASPASPQAENRKFSIAEKKGLKFHGTRAIISKEQMF